MKDIIKSSVKLLFLVVVLVAVVLGYLSFTKNPSSEKKLQYLFAANGGMVGYFDDGTVVGCPRCDFIRRNVDNLYTGKIIRNWDLKNAPESFDQDQSDPYLKSSWVMVNYEWTAVPEAP